MIKKLIQLLFLLFGLKVGIFCQPVQVDHWESVVYAADTWRYYVGINSGPATGWQNAGFDVMSWPQGQGGFGYNDNDDNTILPNPPNPTAVFTRIEFNITDTSQIALAVLNMDFDDGFVAWINGVEVARANLGIQGDYPAYNTPAVDHEALMIGGLNPASFYIQKGKLRDCLINGNNVLSVQVNNTNSSSSDMSCLAWLSVGLTTADITYRAVPSWFVEPFEGFPGSYHPLVIIQTHGTTILSEPKVMVDMGIIDNGPGMLNQIQDDWNGYQGKVGIEYRGSSSMMFPKKNYGFETRNDIGGDSAVSLLGLPAETDWVLHGPYSDKSLMRNYLAYNMAGTMGHYAPRTRFCEVFIDQQYQGLYVLVEKIKRDSNRVDIARLDTADVIGNDLTGGYIVKIDRSADGSYTDGWFSPYLGTGTGNSNVFFAWHYPKRDVILPVQMNYIRNRITQFETALNGSNYRDPYTGYRNYIDVNSFIDYFLLVELSKNTDGFRLSTFLHKDRDDRDRLIHMGPVWDYDLAFGNADYLEAFNWEGWNYTIPADGWGTPFWWTKLISDPYFANQLKCRWSSLRDNIMSNSTITELIDAYADTLGQAIDRNFDMWPIHGTYIWPNAYVGNNYSQDLDFMKGWILSRLQWMDSNMPGVCTLDTEDKPENDLFVMLAIPNPSVGLINLEIQNPQQVKLWIEVVNIQGSIVYAEMIDGDISRTINRSMSAGIYLVKITDGREQKTLKVIVQ